MNAIDTNSLTKCYGNKSAVNGLELSVHEGEFFCLLGLNGAGKTTTIKMLTCLLKPTSGDAILLGHSIVDEPYEVKKITNVSPQETAVAQKLTVRENLELFAGIYGCDDARIEEIIDDLGLNEYTNTRASRLSGGWKRRLSIAMALISEPKILFLDEPAQGLDVLAQRTLWKFISSLKGKLTLILTTHDMKEAESLADRVGIMLDGKIVAIGTVNELKSLTKTGTLEEAFVKIATHQRGGAK